MTRLTLPFPFAGRPLSLLAREPFYPLLALLLAALVLAFATLGVLKPLAEWHWVDLLSEGGMAVMVGVWLVYVRGSRPAGRVTTWLVLGLAAMLVGEWVDALDEIWRLPKAALWDNALEALTPLGMVLLTVGLHHWSQEQRVLSRQLAQRERFVRDHRAVDRVTQLADAGYMAQQIQLERDLGRDGCVAMLGLTGFDGFVREHGIRAADRALEAAGLTLLLNLREGDLLCRYAGDRFVALLPGCSAAEGERLVGDLQAALATLNLRPGLRLPVRAALHATAGTQSPEQLLLDLLQKP
ncbi:diguanylate cyclase domain-containing protein [Roseateles asaccharophilus]|uniref:GGDEF domain-containing protein n=1 Tax=Roseateles asaccharophilus TaxID=582607 RepID=A0ABU2AAI9_9BURK|nr:diguanylate cyclase [Roseateles asaccharophilus]MDR7334221.1 GGDEF domain-containing protein [Roseateles asaccharophilus]